MPDDQKAFIEEWKVMHPKWKFKLWNEQNAPMYLDYMKTALKNEKWSNMSNYTRLHAICKEGGIYMDTDFKVLKPLTPLLKHKCFLGFERDDSDGLWVNNAFIGCEAENPFVAKLMESLLEKFDGIEQANLSSPVLTTEALIEMGLKKYKSQNLKGIKIYTKEYFYPIQYNERFNEDKDKSITSETYAVHMWADSWKTVEELKRSYFVTKKSLDYNVSRLRKLETQYESAAASVNSLQKKNDTLSAKLITQYESASASINSLQKKNDTLSAKLITQYESASASINSLQKKNDTLSAKLISVNAEREQFVTEIKELTGEMNELDAQLKQVSREKNELDAQLKQVSREKGELKDKLKRTYAEKSDLNIELKKTYVEKIERELTIKELQNKLNTLNRLYYVRVIKWFRRVVLKNKTL